MFRWVNKNALIISEEDIGSFYRGKPEESKDNLLEKQEQKYNYWAFCILSIKINGNWFFIKIFIYYLDR